MVWIGILGLFGLGFLFVYSLCYVASISDEQTGKLLREKQDTEEKQVNENAKHD